MRRVPDGDWLREMISYAAQRLMDLEVEGLCGAGFGERSEDRDSITAMATVIGAGRRVPAAST